MLIIVFPEDIRTLLDFGNILSFCVAPPAALAMLVLVTRKRLSQGGPTGTRPADHRRSWTLFLLSLTVLYLRHIVMG